MIRPKMFRKRFIPMEIVDMKNDELIYRSDELIITRWKPFKLRHDFKGGVSYIFLKEGYKISRFYDEYKNLLYIYCDIIDTEYIEDKDKYIFTDLLADVKIYNDGRVVVLDLDEVADMLKEGVIDIDMAAKSLKRLDKLLNMIYKGNFPPDICKNEIYW
ncbi:MAG: DUF402 domain-containing protein [Clostridiales bacterium]